MFAGLPGRAPLTVGVVLVVALGATSTALAHPLIDRARERYHEADFAGALREMTRAENANDLTRDDFLELLALRALVQLALRSNAGMEADLARLVSIAPDHRLGNEAPPVAQEALEAARRASPGALSIRVVAEAQPGGVSLSPDVQNDGRSLVREARVFARTGGGRWESAVDGVLMIQAAPGVSVEYYALAIGPGGAPIASLGSRTDPRRWTSTETGAMSGSVGPDPGHDGGGGDGGGGVPTWVWVAGGVGVATVATVVVVLIATSSSGEADTDVGLPMVAGTP